MQNALEWLPLLAHLPMQKRLAQTGNCTEIGANLTGNCTKISTNIANCTNCTKIGANPILQLTKIGADHIYITAKSSSIMRISHARANCTSYILIRRVFNNKVI
jgi:hypothetical protein